VRIKLNKASIKYLVWRPLATGSEAYHRALLLSLLA